MIPKQRIAPTTHNIEQNSLIPQWAIAVIVIGAGSLLFVIIFGAAVVSVAAHIRAHTHICILGSNSMIVVIIMPIQSAMSME